MRTKQTRLKLSMCTTRQRREKKRILHAKAAVLVAAQARADGGPPTPCCREVPRGCCAPAST